jgi:succinoglycan biosynthesis transport protein ExoP
VPFGFSRVLNKQDGAWVRHDDVVPAIRRANRRRLYVFLGTLAAALIIGLAYTWLRPAEYRASARIEITPTTGAATVTSLTPAGPV